MWTPPQRGALFNCHHLLSSQGEQRPRGYLCGLSRGPPPIARTSGNPRPPDWFSLPLPGLAAPETSAGSSASSSAPAGPGTGAGLGQRAAPAPGPCRSPPAVAPPEAMGRAALRCEK